MPRGCPLTVEQREQIYHMHTMNYRHDEIAKQFGIAVNTVSKVVSRQRALEQEKREGKVAEIIIAGDKKNGRLVSVGTDRYEGSCLIDGKMKKKAFTAPNGKKATEQWEQWCQGLRDEQHFMDMVERKNEPLEESKAVCGAPLDPIEEIRSVPQTELPTDEEIYEAQEEIDAQAEKVLEATGVPLADTSEPAYLIWAKRPAPRCYGLFRTMEDALSELDRLNEVAVFLGGESVFEVEEVAWR